MMLYALYPFHLNWVALERAFGLFYLVLCLYRHITWKKICADLGLQDACTPDINIGKLNVRNIQRPWKESLSSREAWAIVNSPMQTIP